MVRDKFEKNTIKNGSKTKEITIKNGLNLI
jgi:hypothetical protein